MNKKIFKITILVLILLIIIPKMAFADSIVDELQEYINNSSEKTVDTVNILIIMTLLTLIPSFLILTSCFTRIIVVFSFLRNALGTQQSPPNQLLVGLSLFITIFVMQPVYTNIYEGAVGPYIREEITRDLAVDKAIEPMKNFMIKETREKDLALFLRAQGVENVKEAKDLSLLTVVPAFAISELKTAFSIGFILYIPFLVIDMVVASILMSMGMFMLPPVMISLPFKILLFILVDGWNLVIQSMLKGFL